VRQHPAELAEPDYVAAVSGIGADSGRWPMGFCIRWAWR